jgi:hypothetical protein
MMTRKTHIIVNLLVRYQSYPSSVHFGSFYSSPTELNTNLQVHSIILERPISKRYAIQEVQGIDITNFQFASHSILLLQTSNHVPHRLFDQPAHEQEEDSTK